MSSLVEVKVARDQGVFLDSSLRDTKAPHPPSHTDDREKKEFGDSGGEVKEKEYIPLHVAREKIITLQDELRNMKRRHIVVIEAMQKEFTDRDNESRDAYNVVLNQAKDQAKSRIHVHKTRGEKFRTELQRERAERERQYTENANRLSENKARIDSLDRIIIELKAALEKHKEQLKAAKDDSNNLLTQVEEGKRNGRDLEAATEERDRMRKSRDDQEAEVDRLHGIVRDGERKVAELELRLDVMNRERGDAASNGSTLAKEEEDLLRKQLADMTRQLDEARKRSRLPTGGSSASVVASNGGTEEVADLRARLAETQQDLDEISQLLEQQEEEPGNTPRSELAKRLREALRAARSDLSHARSNREQLDAQVEVKDEPVVGEDPVIGTRRRELRDQIARLQAQIDAINVSLAPRVSTLEAKEVEYAPMATEVKRLFDIAKPLDEERARLLATYRLLQDTDGKPVPFGPAEVRALERLNELNELIPSIRAIIEPIFRDLKDKDKNEKERERIKGTFAALKEEMKQKKDAGDDEGAAALKEKALAEKKEYESLGGWLAAYPAKREQFDTKKAEMTTLEGERQLLCNGPFRFSWMKNGTEEKITLRAPATDDLKRLGDIYGHRSRFTEAKAAMDPLKKQLDVLRTEIANDRVSLTTNEEELKRLKAEFDALPPAPVATGGVKKSVAVAAPKSTLSSTNSRTGGNVSGGVDPAVVSRMEREAAADKKSALDKQRTAFDTQIDELNERIRKLEKVIDDMRGADTDERLRVLDQQLKDERVTYEKKIATLQASTAAAADDKSHMDDTKKLNAEIARLTESLRKAEADLKKRPAAAPFGSAPPSPIPPSTGGAGGGADPAALAAAEERVHASETKIAGLNDEIAKIRDELDAALSAKRKAEDHGVELQGRIDAFGAKEAPLLTNVAIRELQDSLSNTKDSLENETKKAHQLEAQLRTKTDELAAETAEVGKLRAHIDTITQTHSNEVAELKAQAEQLSADAKQQFTDMETNLTTASNTRAAELKATHDAKVAQLDAEIADLKSKLSTSEGRANDLDGKLTAETALRESTQKSLADLDTEHKSLMEVHSVCDTKITALTTETNERKDIMDKQAAEIKDFSDQIAFMKLRVQEEQDRRKKLQFELEDAKGKIRVYARVRPFSKKEIENKEDDAVRLGANNWSLELHWPEYGASGELRKDTWLPFTFDAVFHPKLGGATQDQVFEECKAFVELAQNGVNTCIFCYGQSGTGKTFTMSGVSSNPDLRGLKPRAIHYIFDTAKKNASTHEYIVKAYAVEVFNDTLVDVFWKHSRIKATGSEKPSKWGPPPQLDLKNEMDPKTKQVKRVRIDGVIEHEFKDPEEMVAFLDAAEVRRATRATALNPESSRSHLIFAITITTKIIAGKDKGKSYTGKISLCDLAGSERPSKAEVAGLPPAEQAALTEEGKHINMSLSNLRLVFEKLGSQDKKTIIDYTQSTLTKVMRDSLGGNAKALMFVNLGPAQSNQNESKDSLGFGKLVSNIITQQKASVDSDNSGQIKDLQFKLEQYEKKFGSL